MESFKRNHWQITLLFVVLFNSLNLFGQQDTIDTLTNNFIETKTVSERVMIVKLGANAITSVATLDGIVVFDAGMSNSLSNKFRRIIEEEFNRDDFACLINTHSHPDHTGGNQVFSDIKIIGHENCTKGLAENWKYPEKVKVRLQQIITQLNDYLLTMEPGSDDWTDLMKQKILYQHTLQDFMTDRVVTLPTLTFNDTLTLHFGDVTCQLIYFGKAHSESDILIHIPEEKILMTGDLFSAWGKLHFDNKTGQDKDRWMVVKQWVSGRMDAIETIITGHGQILSKKDLELFLSKIGNYQIENQN